MKSARSAALPLSLVVVLGVAQSVAGCRGADSGAGSSSLGPGASSSARGLGSAAARAVGSIGPPERPPPPRQGMVWIPGGALVAGTPPDQLPRKVDEEMRGEQVILHGFYMDVFPYPNEEGAIPLTNVTRDEALALCAERDKRLCTELEWERACKGPSNRIYEYGDRHRPDRCGTGVAPSLRPAGLRVGCRSDFGIRDLHGGAFEWTSSSFGRGTSGLATVRGGNGTAGEVAARCANAESRTPESKSGLIGFRCCAGEPNPTEVTLNVRWGKRLDEFERIDKPTSTRLLAALPEEATRALARSGSPRIERLWVWRPVGNEDLSAAAVCSGIGTRPVCGVLIAREELGRATSVAWAPSGLYIASLHMERDPKDVWLLGGDEVGRFKRLIAYAWGKVTVHGEDRRVGKEDTEKKSKSRSKGKK
ncbi:MAG TPA: SUMF1/EgtB/PvdO family nonheme iron enzyme [Polyangiaceae bacterium]|nr:SUMF1/EgtB/PvdO family nonheme iron enzyme [Polyangiaceae bacterium]